MDGQTVVTIFATAVLIFSMWFTYKITQKERQTH